MAENQENREKIKESPKKNVFSQLAIDFLSNTTAHGLGHLVGDKKVTVRLLWVIVIIACQCVLYYQIYPLCLQYKQRPTKTNVKLKHVSTQIFPVVTFCTTNAIKKSSIDEFKSDASLHFNKNHRRQKRSDKFEEQPPPWFPSLPEKKPKPLLQIPGVIESNQADDKYIVEKKTLKTYISKFEMLKDYSELGQHKKEGVFKYGHSLEETIIDCTWKSIYNCNGFKWWKTNWHWRFGNCYSFNSSDGGRPMKVNSIDPDNGLAVTLKINESEFQEDLTSSKGIIVHIGEQGGRMEPYLNGHSLPPNYVHYITLGKEKVKRADPFKNKSCVPHTLTDLGERSFTNRYITKYSPQMCRQICLARHQIMKCDCTSHWLPSLNSNRTCEWKDSKCVNKLIVLSIEDKLPCLKDCRMPCDETLYDKEVSSRSYTKDLSKNTLHVVISFKTLEEKITEDVEYYFLENLLADIGGQLGLFSGISVLTVVEVVFFFGNLIFLIFQCKNQKKQNNDNKILLDQISTN